MKLLLSLLLAVGFSLGANADAWDDLTKEQATALAAFLKKNPYVIDYCDCCDPGDTYLMKVISTEIVTCEWNPEKFSVKAEVIKIAKLEHTDVGLNEHTAAPLGEAGKATIYMNYTFGYDKVKKWAVPLFKLVSYEADRNHICKGGTNFPQPTNNSGKELDAGYTKWYSKAIKKVKKAKAKF
jgi:hypothetical protein